MPLAKPTASSPGASSNASAPMGGEVFKPFTTILSFLASPKYPDGSSRQLGTLQLFTEGGSWKACVRDKDNKRYAFVTAQGLDDLLLSIEEGLETDRLDWRADKPFPGRNGK